MRHECCFISYVYPKDVFTAEKDGISLETRYEYLPLKSVEVRPVEQVLFRAPLVEPPPFEEPTEGRKRTQRVYYVLNEDVYRNF